MKNVLQKLTLLPSISFFTVSAIAQMVTPCANLTPSQPSGWDDKIVLSTVKETNTSSSTFYDSQFIYLDWALINNGNCDISTVFYIKIYIDDELFYTEVEPGVSSGSNLSGTDINLGRIAGGSHTIKIIVDANGDVTESDEGDNEYSRTIFVIQPVCANLTPYKHEGWDDKIVIALMPGANTSADSIYNNQNIYINWAIINDGLCDTYRTFDIEFYIDGALAGYYELDTLASGEHFQQTDINIGAYPPGTHTFSVVCDSSNHIWELNENDNEFTKQVTVLAIPDVNLTPFRPEGWDDNLVLSTVTGTSKSAPVFYTNQIIYMDLAVLNNGTVEVSDTFYTYIFVDDLLDGYLYSTDLLPDYYGYITDLSFGPLSAGSHTFKIVHDALNKITEINENDNEYERTITVQTSTGIYSEDLAVINVYPNPATDHITIEFEGNIGEITFTILNAAGNTVYSGIFSDKIMVPAASLIPGLYLIRFYNGKSVEYKRFIKE
jgi:hypothetical protein